MNPFIANGQRYRLDATEADNEWLIDIYENDVPTVTVKVVKYERQDKDFVLQAAQISIELGWLEDRWLFDREYLKDANSYIIDIFDAVTGKPEGDKRYIMISCEDYKELRSPEHNLKSFKEIMKPLMQAEVLLAFTHDGHWRKLHEFIRGVRQ